MPRSEPSFGIIFGVGNQHADAPHALGLLRPRRKRPCRRRAAEQRDELAPLSFDHLVGAGEQCRRHFDAEHSAVWALTTSSNLLAWTAGKSAGLAPLRMRPV